MREQEKTCCFTGHRSSKLPFISDDQHHDTVMLKEALSTEIFGFMMSGCHTFYMGCGEGMDVIFGELVLGIKKRIKGVRLICVPPYIGFEKTHNEPWRSRCEAVIRQADETVNLGDHPVRGGYFIRNRYMVDRATDVLAVYNGGTGGTAYTLEYASKQNRDITIFSIRNGKLWLTVDCKPDGATQSITSSTGQ